MHLVCRRTPKNTLALSDHVVTLDKFFIIRRIRRLDDPVFM